MRPLGAFVVAATIALFLASSALAQPHEQVNSVGTRTSIQVHLEGFAKTAEVVRAPDGEVYFDLRAEDGRRLRLTPDELAERLASEPAMRPWWAKVLNISSARSLVWVVLGFLGQLLFTGRMLVQWVTSERLGRSVVTSVFWWLSLAGATLLVAYFVWRRDIVGVLGQAFGWIVYVRNLRLLSLTANRAKSRLD